MIGQGWLGEYFSAIIPRQYEVEPSQRARADMSAENHAYARAMPPLPRDDAIRKVRYQGPTDESNWVIPGILMAGAYPAAQEDNVHYPIIESILSLGITTFVCLQAEYEHDPNIPEFMWRQGYKLRTYIFDALRILRAAEKDPTKKIGQMCAPSKLDFRHVPIVDCSTTNDSIVLELARDIIVRLQRGENIYVHCWGGHGRAGTVVSIVLGLMYNLHPDEALRRCQQFHDTRRAPLGVPSPQTLAQRQQVVRIIKSQQNLRNSQQTVNGNTVGWNPNATNTDEKENAISDASTVMEPLTITGANVATTFTAAQKAPPVTASAFPGSHENNAAVSTGMVNNNQSVSSQQQQQQLPTKISPTTRSLAPPKTVAVKKFINNTQQVSAAAVAIDPKPVVSNKTSAQVGLPSGKTGGGHMANIRRVAAQRPRPRKRPVQVNINGSNKIGVVPMTSPVLGTSVAACGGVKRGGGNVSSAIPIGNKTRRVMGTGQRRQKNTQVGVFVRPNSGARLVMNGGKVLNSSKTGSAHQTTIPSVPVKKTGLAKKQKLANSPRTRNLIVQQRQQAMKKVVP